MKKEIEFMTRIDTSDFDRAVADMQKKLKEIYRPADNAAAQRATATRLEGMGLGGNLSKPATEAYQKSINQTKVEMDKFIASQAKGLQESAKLIAKQDNELKRLRTTQQSLNKDSEEYLKIQKQIANQESNLSKQREQAAGAYKALNQGISASQQLGPGGSVGGGIGGGGAIGGMLGGRGRAFLGNAGMVGGIVGGVATGIGTAGAIAAQYSGFGQRVQEAQGSATQGTVGQDLSRIYAGKSPFESAFMPERKAAEGLAKQKEDRNRMTDRMMGIGSLGAMGLGAAGVIGGLGVGAASLLATPFTAGGSALGLPAAGAMIGAGVGMFGAGASGFANDRNREGILGGKDYDKLISAERAKDFRENLENIKNQDPVKKLAMDRYEQSYKRDLGTQRMLGINDFQMYGGGGFQNMAHRAGFMSEEAQGMAQNVIGAGGSARMGRDATFGLQMERSGLTNAGGILGSLSNSIQSTTATKQATISIMAEAFQQGLDNTDFAEENRRFTQSVATVIGKSGATSEADQDRISKMFGQFLGERTNKGVEAAGSAYEAFQQRGSQTTGRRGAVRMAEAMNDPVLKAFDTQDLTELLAARPDQLKESDPFMQAKARQASEKLGRPVSPKDLLDSLSKGSAKARFLTPGRAAKAEGYSKDINSYLEKNKMSFSDFVEKANSGDKSLDQDAVYKYGLLKGEISKENPQGYQDQDIAAQAGEMIKGVPAMDLQDQKKRQKDSLDKQTDRMGDQTNAAGAAGEDKGRYALNQMTDDIKKAASAASMFADIMSDAGNKMRGQSGDRNAALPQAGGLNTDIVDRLTGSRTNPNMSVQPQGSKERK